MIGVMALIGVPFWPWQAAQTSALLATSSAACADATAQPQISAAPKTVEIRLLYLFTLFLPLPSGLSRRFGPRPSVPRGAILPVCGRLARGRLARAPCARGGRRSKPHRASRYAASAAPNAANKVRL